MICMYRSYIWMHLVFMAECRHNDLQLHVITMQSFFFKYLVTDMSEQREREIGGYCGLRFWKEEHSIGKVKRIHNEIMRKRCGQGLLGEDGTTGDRIYALLDEILVRVSFEANFGGRSGEQNGQSS